MPPDGGAKAPQTEGRGPPLPRRRRRRGKKRRGEDQAGQPATDGAAPAAVRRPDPIKLTGVSWPETLEEARELLRMAGGQLRFRVEGPWEIEHEAYGGCTRPTDHARDGEKGVITRIGGDGSFLAVGIRLERGDSGHNFERAYNRDWAEVVRHTALEPEQP